MPSAVDDLIWLNPNPTKGLICLSSYGNTIPKLFARFCKRLLDRVPQEYFTRFISELGQRLDYEQRSHLFRDLTRSLEIEDVRRLYVSELVKTIEPGERFLLPNFDKGFGRETDRFLTYQKDFISFQIRQDEKVLDVGPGAYPFPYATHLADLYEGETTHRTEPLVSNGLPFEKCDIAHLPYKDKEFDFVYCSHVLEHVKDPDRACQELMRVGKRGYIETPTRLSDIMLNFTRLRDHHRWHVILVNNTLLFIEWCANERRDTGINDFYLMLHSKYRNPFQDLVHHHRDLFVNMLLWEEQFYYYVIDHKGKLVVSNTKA